MILRSELESKHAYSEEGTDAVIRSANRILKAGNKPIESPTRKPDLWGTQDRLLISRPVHSPERKED